MIRRDINQYLHGAASAPPPIQPESRLDPPAVHVAVPHAGHGHTGNAVPPPPATYAGALPSLALDAALLFALGLLLYSAVSWEAPLLRRILGRYRAFLGIGRTECSSAPDAGVDFPIR